MARKRHSPESIAAERARHAQSYAIGADQRGRQRLPQLWRQAHGAEAVILRSVPAGSARGGAPSYCA